MALVTARPCRDEKQPDRLSYVRRSIEESVMTNQQPTAMTTAAATARAGRREWTGLAVLALPTLLLSLDMSVLYLALPELSADLGASATQQLWIMDIYGFLIAGFLVTMGTLGDRIGRRRLLMIGAAAFGVASVAAAYSATPEMLIGARALLGIAGATLMPSTLALISNMFRDPQQRGVAIAVWMCCFMGGMSVGPLIGGVLLANFWWGSAFLLGVPVMALLLVTAPLLLPEYRDPDAGRLDLASVALMLAAVLSAIYGLKELAVHGFAGGPLLAIAIGGVVGGMFLQRQRRLPAPLLDLTLFRDRTFSVALGLNLGGGVVMAGTFLLVTQYLQMVEGLSPLHAGLWLVPMNLAMAVATMATPQLARRVRPGYVMTAGFVIAATGLLVITQVAGVGGLWMLVAGFTLTSVGIALPSALGIDLIVGSAPKEKAGSAAGMSEMSGEFGIALGVAVLGSVGAAVYRATLTIAPDVPPAAAHAADEGIVGAVLAAAQLPGDVGALLTAAAREAFTTGLNTAAGVGSVVFVAMAVLALSRMQHLRPSGEASDEHMSVG
jgi:MFS transporter, DHA2 family, multidrug resistance protein